MLDLVTDTVMHARNRCDDIHVGVEDATRADVAHAIDDEGIAAAEGFLARSVGLSNELLVARSREASSRSTA